jgi:large subunit ribosomal protein L25
MEKTLLLNGQVRQHTGTKAAAKVREQGRIPAVLYGHKQEPMAISLDAHNLVEGLHHGHRVIDVKIGKAKEKVIVKDLQYDYLGKDIIHVDLMRVDVTETVTVSVPIELKGQVKVAEGGGIIEAHADSLEVRCKVTDIPESIVVLVREMDIGDSLHASDVELPAGVTLVSNPQTLLFTCSMVAAAKSTEEIESAEPAAPEVIGEAERKEQESEEE